MKEEEIEQLLETLNDNSDLDQWYLPNNPPEDCLEIFIKVNNTYYLWREGDIIQRVTLTPAPRLE